MAKSMEMAVAGRKFRVEVTSDGHLAVNGEFLAELDETETMEGLSAVGSELRIELRQGFKEELLYVNVTTGRVRTVRSDLAPKHRSRRQGAKLVAGEVPSYYYLRV